MEDLENEQEIQENLYEFPYHHIPKFVNGNFSATRTYRGSCHYVASMNFLISKVNEIEFTKLLDIGCGDGKFLYEISRNDPTKTYIGIDFSEKAILLAKAMSPNVKFICGDITQNELSLGTFNVITLIETLEHIKPDLIPNFVKTLYNYIEMNGKIIITVPSTNVVTSPKHYQHFDLKLLKKTLSPYFQIDKYYFVNKMTREARIIKSILTNRFFALNHQPSLNKLLKRYEKKSLHGDENNSEGILVICSINKDKEKF